MARADPKRKTSRGRTALEIARKADVDLPLVSRERKNSSNGTYDSSLSSIPY